MDTSTFKRIGRLLRELYLELRREILDSGVDLMSQEYEILLKRGQERIRTRLLEKMGFTIEEYREAKALVEAAPKEPSEVLNQIKEGIDEVRDKKILTEREVKDIAKAEIKAPQIINKIVKEVEKPTVIHETVVERVEYDETQLQEKITDLSKKIDEINIPDEQKIKEDMRAEYSKHLEENINALGMPNFRKLGMGLQAQIDQLRTEIATVEGSDVDSVNGQTGVVVLDTGDIAEVTDANYVSDAQLVVLGNTSGTNTGDQTSIVGITGTKAQFDTAVTDGNFLYVGDITQYTDEMAQDAVGNAVGNGLDYNDTSGAISVDETELDHNTLSNLTAGDVHTQYALLAGRSGGQILKGGTASGDDLTLQSTTNATKGDVFISDGTNNHYNFSVTGGGSTVFNETGIDLDLRIESDNLDDAVFLQGSNGYVGLGTDAPTGNLHIIAPDLGATREVPIRVEISDALGDLFALYNSTVTSSRFSPTFTGSQGSNSTNQSLTFVSQVNVSNDTGTTPEMVFVARRYADADADPLNGSYTDIAARPLFDFRNRATSKMLIDYTGVVKLSGTAKRATTEGTNHLDIFDGTAPVGTLANGISLYSTSGELRVMDAAGNPTLLSPHDKDNNWIFDSYVGKGKEKKRIVVDMQKMMYKLNEMLGGGFIHEYEITE